MIKNKEVNEFDLVVCDINNLKTINDLCGHVAGDNAIKEAKNIISDIFKNSPVYRIGGDEFVVLLEGKDYTNRHKLIKEFENMNKRNVYADRIVIAVGLSDFDKNKDYILQDIFNRADNLMYKNKEELKNNMYPKSRTL
jgi:diguanylate cyclase (GGDEF)-like protein